MDLKDFVKQTIKGIVEATLEVQKEFQEQGVIINPPIDHENRGIFRAESARHTFNRIEEIEFDVAVTATSETGGSGKAGLRVFSADIGIDGKHERRNEEVSRVKFSIPLVLSQSKAELSNRLLASSEANASARAMGLGGSGDDWLP